MQQGYQSFDNVCKFLAEIGITITEEMLMAQNADGDNIFHIAMQRGDQSFDNVCKSLAEAGIIITEEMLLQSNAKSFAVLGYAALQGNLKRLTDAIIGSSNNEEALSIFIEKMRLITVIQKKILLSLIRPMLTILANMEAKSIICLI